MEELKFSQDLKPLYANLKRIKIGGFLHSKEFNLKILEWGLDGFWKQCTDYVASKKRVILLGYHDTEDEEHALYIMLSTLYLGKKQDKVVFVDFFFKTLRLFIESSPVKLDLSQVINSFSELSDRLPVYQSDITQFKRFCTSLNKKKPQYEEQTPMQVKSLQVDNEISSKKVFIVHGHNDSIKINTARILEKIGLQPIILHEQPNNGKTIIEKFEQNSEVGFAIVLLTSDDVGKSKKEENLMSRARQNVILELGYFIGKLGRSRVVSLYEHGIEIPSDMYGVVYIEIDNSEAWKFTLCKELKSAGYDIDLNKII